MAGEKPKKSIGSMLKNIFIDDSNDEEPELPVDTKTSPGLGEKFAIPTQPTQPVEMSKDVVNSLKKCLDDANLDGYDYYEFVKAIETIDMPSEQQKFKIAFSVIQNLPGMSVDLLIKTADHYTEALAEHKKAFAVKFDKVVKDNITDVEAEIATTETEINKVNERIVADQKLSAELVNKRIELTNQVQNNRFEVERQKTEYNLAHGAFVAGIVENKNKIAKYLKETK